MIYAQPAGPGTGAWGVATTCHEPLPLVLAFVAHHLALGAAEIWMFLDQPQPAVERRLATIPQVKVTVCDKSYWRQTRFRKRPPAIEARQVTNLYKAYSETELPWLIHLDSDEFLHFDLPVSDLLEALPEALDYLICRPHERAYVEGQRQQTLFDGVFRTPIPQDWTGGRHLFSGSRRLLDHGLLGHRQGKSFLRTGRTFLPGIHSPRRSAKDRDQPLAYWVAQKGRMLHFDGLTALHWSAKLLRAVDALDKKRADPGARRKTHRDMQIIRMQRAGGDLGAAFDMHNTLKTIPCDQLDRLTGLGLIEHHSIDVAGALEALGLQVDITRRAFDQALAQHQPLVADWLEAWECLLEQG